MMMHIPKEALRGTVIDICRTVVTVAIVEMPVNYEHFRALEAT